LLIIESKIYCLIDLIILEQNDKKEQSVETIDKFVYCGHRRGKNCEMPHKKYAIEQSSKVTRDWTIDEILTVFHVFLFKYLIQRSGNWFRFLAILSVGKSNPHLCYEGTAK
jgi:hypothetical protein